MTPLLLLALSAAPDAGVAAPIYSRDAVNRVVRRHKDDLKACGESTGIGAAEITLTFVIGTEGKVRDVTTETMNVTDAPQLLSCVITALRSWSFPVPAKPLTVQHYRFVVPGKL
ncbi:MAG: AgmX/PglI C-terminal domain-containing protein [Archangium sp.]